MTSAEHSPDPIYSYNLDDSHTPGHLKVRWKIRVATGVEAERLDILQQDAIVALLAWADKQHRRTEKHHPINTEIPGRNSRGAIPANA